MNIQKDSPQSQKLTIDLKSNSKPKRKSRASISTARNNVPYDNLDTSIRSYLLKNQANYERTIERLQSIESSKAQQAQRMLSQMKENRKQHLSGTRQTRNIERNNSVPASKQIHMDLKIAQQAMKRIKQPQKETLIDELSQMNSIQEEENDHEQIRKPMNFDQELEKLNQYYSRNETLINQLVKVQKDLQYFKK